MSDHPTDSSLLAELEKRQDEVLDQLESLNERIEAMLRELTAREGDDSQPAEPVPQAA